MSIMFDFKNTSCDLDTVCGDVLDCQQFCVKVNNFFQCSCNHGYVLALDGKSCQGTLKYYFTNTNFFYLFLCMQMLMSVHLDTIIVMIMHFVTTIMEVLHVHVMKDTMAMGISALVC